MVCAAKGYNARFVLYRYSYKEGATNARSLITSAFGPEVFISTEPEKYLAPEQAAAFFKAQPDLPHVIAGKVDCANMEIEDPNCVWVDQIYNKQNYIGQKSMAKEIYHQLDGKIDAWGCSVGSGATLFGVYLGFKELGLTPGITFGAVPDGTEQYLELQGRENNRGEFKVNEINKKISGAMGLDKWVTEQPIVEEMIDSGCPDKIFCISDEDARDMANRLCREEGVFCGMSSGANVVAALKIAANMREDQNVVTTVVDRRDRYLSETPNERYAV